jgi:phosphate starvation-inducible PhoH-like protein
VSEDSQSYKRKIEFKDQNEAMAAFGEYDSNLKQLEKKYGIVIHARGTYATVFGKKNDVDMAVDELAKLKDEARVVAVHEDRGVVLRTSTGKPIKAMSTRQKEYFKAMETKDLVVAIGPAGTGKTFLACVEAARRLKRGDVKRVILTRPVVEAGEKLGFLPGDLYEKVNPYLKPLYDAFYALIGPEKFQRYRKDDMIEIVPLAYMRGRTLDDAMIILDEAVRCICF